MTEYRTISKKEACELLGVCYYTLQQWVKQGRVHTCLIPASPNSYKRHGIKTKQVIIYDELLLSNAKYDKKYINHKGVE